MITLKNIKSGAILKLKEKDYKTLENKGRLKYYTTVEVKPSKEIKDEVKANKAKSESKN